MCILSRLWTPRKEFILFFNILARFAAIYIRRKREFSVVPSRFGVSASRCDCALCESILVRKSAVTLSWRVHIAVAQFQSISGLKLVEFIKKRNFIFGFPVIFICFFLLENPWSEIFVLFLFLRDFHNFNTLLVYKKNRAEMY